MPLDWVSSPASQRLWLAYANLRLWMRERLRTPVLIQIGCMHHSGSDGRAYLFRSRRPGLGETLVQDGCESKADRGAGRHEQSVL